MSHVYTRALGLLNPTTLTGDVRAVLVMSNFVDDVDAEFVNALTLDEYDGSAYVRKPLTSEAFAVNLADDRFEFTADPIVWVALGVGTRQCVGLLLYLHVADDTDSKPLMLYDGAGFPFDGDGSDRSIAPNGTGGFMLIRNAP
jgi:hypothetical protein